MGRTLKFSAERIIARLNVLESVQIPYAGNRALKDLGWYLKGFHQREMAGHFDRPVPYTTGSVRYSVSDLELRLSISGDGTIGQTPRDYLWPAFRDSAEARKPALATRFARRLAQTGKLQSGSYLAPNLSSSGMKRNRYGNPSPGLYAQVLAGVGANEYAANYTGKAGRFFVIDRSSSSHLQPGIYKDLGGRRISQLWRALDAPPSVPSTYPWVKITAQEAADQLGPRLRRRLREALG